MQRVLFNCYDSHVHWQATGEHPARLNLNEMRSPADISNLNVSPSHFRGHWLVGWGWDQNKWSPAEFPNRRDLDSIFPDHPVAFTRADGHAIWINSQALNLLDPNALSKFGPETKGGKVIRDTSGEPTGVLLDHAMTMVLERIPRPGAGTIREWLKSGMVEFNRSGFTHIRDLTCNAEQWNEARGLEDAGELTLAIEQYFDADPFEHFDRALAAASVARADRSRLLRVKGIKIYFDGALGSEGALLSHSYRSGQSGLRLMTVGQFKEAAQRTWEKKFDLAIHVIGDQAAHEVTEAACALWDSGRQGHLHLEHAELLRPETVRLLRGRSVTCHIQPCHWLTDHHWLHEKVGDLARHAFAWADLQQNKILFDFGSDSPIEKPSLNSTLEAIRLSATEGIPALNGDPLSYHEHPDRDWVPNTKTVFENGRIEEVLFSNKSLII